MTYKNDDVDKRIFHAIGWMSHKQRRIAHLSFGAEIIAAADNDYSGLYFKTYIKIYIYCMYIDTKTVGLFA